MRDFARRATLWAGRGAEDGLWTARTLARQRGLRRAALAGLPPQALFGDVSDRYWLWANTAGVRRFDALRSILPQLPDERTQRRFTGGSGDESLRDAHRFYRLVKTVTDRHRVGGFASCRRSLEFGCGWGRITRLFLKDRDGAQLCGVDCLGEVVDIARATNHWTPFEVVTPSPPSALPDAEFDLIYCYSVFSHLSEEVHAEWLAEFRRVLAPGGLIVASTRPRHFFVSCMQQREAEASGARVKNSGARRAFVDTARWVERYDNGDYCHDAVGGGEGLPGAFYGETAIPAAYAERQWPRLGLRVCEYVADTAVCPQHVIVARRA